MHIPNSADRKSAIGLSTPARAASQHHPIEAAKGREFLRAFIGLGRFPQWINIDQSRILLGA
jgi:hypothetical protein